MLIKDIDWTEGSEDELLVGYVFSIYRKIKIKNKRKWILTCINLLNPLLFKKKEE